MRILMCYLLLTIFTYSSKTYAQQQYEKYLCKEFKEELINIAHLKVNYELSSRHNMHDTLERKAYYISAIRVLKVNKNETLHCIEFLKNDEASKKKKNRAYIQYLPFQGSYIPPEAILDFPTYLRAFEYSIFDMNGDILLAPQDIPFLKHKYE